MEVNSLDKRNSNEEIKEIVEILSNIDADVNNAEAIDAASDASAPEREFEYGKRAKSTGLVFESAPVEEFKKNDLRDQIQLPPPEPDRIIEDDPEPVAEEPAKLAVEEPDEFTIPEAFLVNEKYNTPSDTDSSPRIFRTYVPRFTEASEKYRMIDDPRPRKDSDGATIRPTEPVRLTLEEQLNNPTAEIEHEVADAVVLVSAPVKEDETERVSIYKFDADDDEALDDDALAREREEIESLISRDSETVDEPVADETVEEAESVDESDAVYADAVEAEEEIVVEEETPVLRTTTLPDPDPKDYSVIDYSPKKPANAGIFHAPEGASDLLVDPSKSHFEFTHTTQRDGFKDKFLDSLMSIKIRLFAILLFTAVLFGYETVAAFGIFESAVNSLNFSSATLGVIDLVFVIGLFMLVLPEIALSVKQLMMGKITSELMLVPSFIAVAVYSLVLAFSPTAGNVILLGFVFAVSVLCAVSAAYFRLKGDFTAFKVVSKNGEKRIVDKKLTRELTEENMALDGLVDEYSSRTARIFRAGFVTDFFKRTASTSEDSKHILNVMSISAGVALVTALITLFVAGSVVSALAAFALVFLLGCPALTLVSHKLPYYSAQVHALTEESTVVGETAYDEFAEINVVTFEDTEIFGPDDVNLKKFYSDSYSMEKAMQQMCSIFSVTGGPLKNIFENALDRRVKPSPASDIVIDEDGISAEVAGHRICAGSEKYMRRHGIAMSEVSSRVDSGIDTTKVMYAAEDGVVYAKFYIRYSFSEEFTMILPMLKEQGLIPLIYTRDPNVSNELLQILSAGSDCMRVMRRYNITATDDVMYRNVSAGIVTYGDKMNAINVILLAKKYKALIARTKNVEMYAMGAGLGLGALLSVLGMFTVPSFVFGIWHLIWVAILGIAAKGVFSKDKNQ